MTGRHTSTAWDTTASRLRTSGLSSIIPRAIREMSDKSPIKRLKCLTCRSMLADADSINSGRSKPRRRSSWAEVRMGARGLRSSWASTARNSSLRRSASCSASPTRFRSVTSARMPTSRCSPLASARRWARASTQRGRPSPPRARNSACWAASGDSGGAAASDAGYKASIQRAISLSKFMLKRRFFGSSQVIAALASPFSQTAIWPASKASSKRASVARSACSADLI